MAITFKSVPMIFLGKEVKQNKENKDYYLANFMDGGGSIIQYYIGANNHKVMLELDGLEQMKPVNVDLEISSFNMKPQIGILKVDKR